MMLHQNAIKRFGDNQSRATVERDCTNLKLLLNSFRKTFPLSKPTEFSRMKKFSAAILLLLWGCSSLLPPSPPPDPVNRLRHDIDTVLADSLFRQSQACIKIVSLNTGQVLYDRNSTLLIHPASNLKLLTSASALQILGANFRFKTSVLADSQQSGPSVFGNLYLKGYGDPDLSVCDLDSLAANIRSLGIREITGNIVADDSYFDDLYWGNGWMWDDEPDPDEMFISALSVNKNCIAVTITPTATVSDSVIVTVDPPTPYVTVQCNARTVGDTTDYSLNVSRLYKERSNTVTIDGDIPKTSPPHRARVSVWRPALFAAELLKESLLRDSIVVSGAARLGTASPRAVELACRWRPIDSVLFTMNKISDNLSAENLLKTIGALQRVIPGSAQNGIYVENEFLKSFGIDTSACSIVDGSGVSHYNLVTVDQIMQVLIGMARRPNPFHLIYTSLPIAGVDGTLQSRMVGTSAQGNVRGKTGTINGVSSLSGYVTTHDGEILAFSMVMENFILPVRSYQLVQDRICELLARFSRKLPLSASR